MNAPWARPYECDDWTVTTSYCGKTLFRRRDVWYASAVGTRAASSHARYSGSSGEMGATRKEAEQKMRARICRDVKAYEGYLGVIQSKSRKFSADDICPC